MEVGPSHSTIFIGENMGGAKIQPEFTDLLINFKWDHIEVKVVPDHTILQKII